MIAAGSGAWDSLGLTFATPRQRLEYSYDASGNITQIGNTEAAETQTYGYDALNRLTDWSLNGNISGRYEYGETSGNLEKKGTLDLQYNNTSHPHAVSDAVTLLDYTCPVGAICDHDQEVGGSVDNAYGYDANGNMTARPVNGQTYTLGYDAEGHLVSVTGGSYSAQFTYDGDGKRVKSVINGETILFTGGQYEVKIPATGNQEITKYYLAGSTRIALRKYVIPQSMEVEYLLGDHLGSTSVTTDAAGEKISEMRYTPWGEVRYAWKDPGLDTTPAYELTRWTFTGQYSYADDPTTEGVEDFGLMYFNARWVDAQLGRFSQADTLIPSAGDPQAWDRFAYANNNPLKYTDPSGHRPDDGCQTQGCNLTQYRRDLDAQKLAILEAQANAGKCQTGNGNYCSGWDNWVWDNTPSAIAFHKGVSIQAGFGGEFGGYREVSYVFNWRSFEFDTMYTQGRHAYLGTPQLVGGGYYKGISFVYGASSNASITGYSKGGGGTVSVDSGGTVGATYQQAIAVDEDGQRLIGRSSSRPIQSYQFSLGAGGNLLVNAADVGGIMSEGTTQIGSPATSVESLIFQILRFLP